MAVGLAETGGGQALNLLSENDLRTLQTAIDSGLEIEMTRKLQEIMVSARTIRVGPPWPSWVHTILQVRRSEGNIFVMQNLTSVNELRHRWKEW